MSRNNPESTDGAHVASTDAVDQAELPDTMGEARRGKAEQRGEGVNPSDTQDPPVASAG